MTASSQYIVHVTRAGERWDLIAWQYYGDASQFSGIIMANPSAPIEPVFTAGLTLRIPIVAQGQAVPVDLPPWKASGSTGS